MNSTDVSLGVLFDEQEEREREERIFGKRPSLGKENGKIFIYDCTKHCL